MTPGCRRDGQRLRLPAETARPAVGTPPRALRPGRRRAACPAPAPARTRPAAAPAPEAERPSEGARGAAVPSGAWSRSWALPSPPGGTSDRRNGSAHVRAAAPAQSAQSAAAAPSSSATCATTTSESRVPVRVRVAERARGGCGDPPPPPPPTSPRQSCALVRELRKTYTAEVPLGSGSPGAALHGVNARWGAVRLWLMEAGRLPYLVGYAPLRARQWLRNGGRSGTGAATAEANTVSRPSESSSPKFSHERVRVDS